MLLNNYTAIGHLFFFVHIICVFTYAYNTKLAYILGIKKNHTNVCQVWPQQNQVKQTRSRDKQRCVIHSTSDFQASNLHNNHQEVAKREHPCTDKVIQTPLEDASDAKFVQAYECFQSKNDDSARC